MQVSGAVHKVEFRPARDKYPEKHILVLTDRAGPLLTDLAEETYIEVELQGDGKDLRAGDLVSFWGRFQWCRGSALCFECRGPYKVTHANGGK